MKIHSDILTSANLLQETPQDVYADIQAVGSRSRARAFNVRLEYTGTDKRRRRNTGSYGAEDGGYPQYRKAATWDEHGIWMDRLFQIDPYAIIANYNGYDDFITQTTYYIPKGQRAPWLEPQHCGTLDLDPQGFCNVCGELASAS